MTLSERWWKLRSRMQYRVRRMKGWAEHIGATLRHRAHLRTVWCGSYHCPHIADMKVLR